MEIELPTGIADWSEVPANPALLLRLTNTELHSLPWRDIEALHRAALPLAFARLRPLIKVLDQVASSACVDEIVDIEDVVPVLLPHTMYKSYPLSFIEKGNYARLNAWLDGFTAFDLGTIDTGGCRSLDDWLTLIEDRTPVRVYCSSGTSGKVSFVVASVEEQRLSNSGLALQKEPFLNEPGLNWRSTKNRPPLVAPYVLDGSTGVGQMLRSVTQQVFDGDTSKVIALGGRTSADMLWFAGKLRGAQERGELIDFDDPALARLRDEVLASQRYVPEQTTSLFQRVLDEHSGQSLVMFMPWARYHDFACYLRDTGQSLVLGPDSFLFAGGGSKGVQLPDGWRDVVKAHIPLDIPDFFGMSELPGGGSRKCDFGHYHLARWWVPFLLDPMTSVPLPRRGTQCGRFAVYDLLAVNHWGGIITGDELTIAWDRECSCGRTGPYVIGDPQRVGAGHGDDKITCSKTPEAYDRAVEFLLGAA